MKASGILLQNFHKTGEQTLRGHKQNLVHNRSEEKGTMTPQETELDLPVSVCCGVRGPEYNSPERNGAGIRPFEEVITNITPTIVWPQAKLLGRNKAPPINRQLG